MTQSEPQVTESTRIGILHYRHAQRAAVYGLTDLLETAGRLHHPALPSKLEVSVWHDDGSLADPTPPLSALIVPPSLRQGPPEPVTPPLERWILARYHEGTTLCSVCVGAFLLADLHLLDDRPATTHWGLRDEFRRRFPAVRLDTDRLIIDEGDIITAGGLMAWVDLGLQLVNRYLGPTTTLATSRYFLVDPGGREQRFYKSFAPQMTHGDDAILRVQRWIQRHLADDLTVDSMAASARLGKRTFLRRFQRATGLRTGEYLQHLRVAAARELLERSTMTQQQIAWAVGYEDPGAFRRVFVKLTGLSLGEYRRRFWTGVPSS